MNQKQLKHGIGEQKMKAEQIFERLGWEKIVDKTICLMYKR